MFAYLFIRHHERCQWCGYLAPTCRASNCGREFAPVHTRRKPDTFEETPIAFGRDPGKLR